jgi:hypothetical protein
MLINISHDYNVVINPYSSYHNIMKLIVLRLNKVNKPKWQGSMITKRARGALGQSGGHTSHHKSHKRTRDKHGKSCVQEGLTSW